MKTFEMKVVLLIAVVVASCVGQEEINNRRFPDDFTFGVSTSAYQIEGAWDEDGKSESLWDYAVHTNTSFIVDGSNGDVACDSYHRLDQDIAILKELNVSHYRFSLAWTRILPAGVGEEANEAGIQYYRNLIQALRENNIEPLVTLFHWDLPQSLQEQGGFINESIIDWFGNYARVVFSLFGNDVKYWITMNEPKQVCTAGYGYGEFPPAVKSEALLEYQCVYNLIRAHARAWHIYDEEFRPSQNGKISISLDTLAYIPETDSEEDIEAAERIQYFTLGMYANPIYVGDWPEVVKTRVAERSAAEGRTQSRLPDFTDEEISYVKGTHDFFGLNVYSANVVTSLGYDPPVSEPPSKWQDQGVNAYQPDSWETTSFPLTKVVPWTVRLLVKWIKDKYNNPGIIVTENGYPSSGDENDDRRIYYIKGYLSSLRDAMIEDDVIIYGYTVWSHMDNFEWVSGHTQKYGFYKVDFDSPNRTRTPRASAEWYRNVISSRCLVDECVD